MGIIEEGKRDEGLYRLLGILGEGKGNEGL